MIFSSLDRAFLGTGGTVADRRGGESVGEAGRGLSVYGVTSLLRLLALPLVEGRSLVAKLTPESERRSFRRDSSLSGVKYSGPVTWRYSSMTALAVRRYLSTTSLTLGHPLSSLERMPWRSMFWRIDFPFFSTPVMYLKKAWR